MRSSNAGHVKDRISSIFVFFGIAAPSSKRALLAYRNLRRAGGRWVMSLIGIFFATFLMAFQGSLLYGFSQAASRIVDAVNADLWIVGKGTPTFDFVSPIPARYSELALGIDGVASAGRAVAGWTSFQKSNGDRTFVFAVGVEDSFRGRIPSVPAVAAAAGVSDSGILIDKSDATSLAYNVDSDRVQIAARRAHLIGTADGFSSFLGTPLVLGGYLDIRRYLRYESQDVAIVLVRVGLGRDVVEVRDKLRTRLIDVDVWTKQEFSQRSRIFWLIQTGAGAALSLAAILGFTIGLVVVAQAMYALTAENIEEFATLKAMGASDSDVRSIVLTQSLICGVIGGVGGLLLVEPFAALARYIVTWVYVPYWMYFLVSGLVLVLCFGAARIAVRPALALDPGRVFRA